MLVLHSQPDSVQHEPCGFLCHAKGAVQFPRRNAVLVVDDHPDSGEPLLKRNRRVLKDRSDLGRELALRVNALALPAALVGEELGVCPTTSGTGHDSIRESQRDHVREAIIGVCEVLDCLLQGLWFWCFIRFHVNKVSYLTNQVKRNLISEVYLCLHLLLECAILKLELEIGKRFCRASRQ